MVELDVPMTSNDLTDEERIGLVENGELPGSMVTAEELGNVPTDEMGSMVKIGDNEIRFRLRNHYGYELFDVEEALLDLLRQYASEIWVNNTYVKFRTRG